MQAVSCLCRRKAGGVIWHHASRALITLISINWTRSLACSISSTFECWAAIRGKLRAAGRQGLLRDTEIKRRAPRHRCAAFTYCCMPPLTAHNNCWLAAQYYSDKLLSARYTTSGGITARFLHSRSSIITIASLQMMVYWRNLTGPWKTGRPMSYCQVVMWALK